MLFRLELIFCGLRILKVVIMCFSLQTLPAGVHSTVQWLQKTPQWCKAEGPLHFSTERFKEFIRWYSKGTFLFFNIPSVFVWFIYSNLFVLRSIYIHINIPAGAFCVQRRTEVSVWLLFWWQGEGHSTNDSCPDGPGTQHPQQPKWVN